VSLVHDIKKLRADSIASLDASRNYFLNTKAAWRVVQQVVRQGHQITIRNQDTGSVVRESELPGLAQQYVSGYLAEATFQHLVSLFEDFVGDFLSLWLNEFPQSLSEKQLGFRVVLELRR